MLDILKVQKKILQNQNETYEITYYFQWMLYIELITTTS